MRAAFKEWAVIVDALGRGEQIVILRKGGISEGRGGFQVDQPEFWLFPTRFHQQREAVLPAAQAHYDSLVPHLPPDDTLRLQYWAQVIAWRNLDSLAAAEALRGQHVWRDEVIAERFEWGRTHNIFALTVRIYCLATPIDLPLLPEYGGCKSWIQLATDVSTEGSVPVLTETDFAAKQHAFDTALGLSPQTT